MAAMKKGKIDWPTIWDRFIKCIIQITANNCALLQQVLATVILNKTKIIAIYIGNLYKASIKMTVKTVIWYRRNRYYGYFWSKERIFQMVISNCINSKRLIFLIAEQVLVVGGVRDLVHLGDDTDRPGDDRLLVLAEADTVLAQNRLQSRDLLLLAWTVLSELGQLLLDDLTDPMLMKKLSFSLHLHWHDDTCHIRMHRAYAVLFIWK